MTIAYWCVLAAGLLPYLTVGIAKWSKRYDNRNPRDYEATLEGRRKRAYFAHLNGFEVFPLFAAGVIIAQQLHAAQSVIDSLALTFIVARLVYIGFYLADKATLRSLAWVVGMGCSIALIVVAARA